VKGLCAGNRGGQRWLRGVFLLLLAAPVMADSGDPGAPSPRESELANLVLQDCGSCHGMTLRGGLGPALRPENLNHLPAEAIAAIVAEGVPGTAMPPWKPLLSAQDIRWISRQLKAGSLVLP